MKGKVFPKWQQNRFTSSMARCCSQFRDILGPTVQYSLKTMMQRTRNENAATGSPSPGTLHYPRGFSVLIMLNMLHKIKIIKSTYQGIIKII